MRARLPLICLIPFACLAGSARVLAGCSGVVLQETAVDSGAVSPDSGAVSPDSGAVAADSAVDGGAHPSAKVPFDVNDVSILLPAPATAEDLALLPSLDGLVTPAQVSMMQLATADSSDPQGGIGSADPAAWHIVSMRFDPCALETTTSTTCHVELRLIAEVIFDANSSGDGGPKLAFDDDGIHVTYELDAADAAKVVADLAALKALDPQHTTDGVPLGIHPAMAATGLSGPSAAAFRALVTKYANPAKLGAVAIFENTGVGQWNFAKATVQDGGLALEQIPFVSGNEVSLNQGAPATIKPTPTGPDNVNAIIDTEDSSGSFFQLSAAAQQSAVNAAVRISNPLSHRLGDNDCIGCHQASYALGRVATVEGSAFTTALAANPDRYIAPAGVTGTEAVYTGGPGEIDVHVFGYFDSNVTLQHVPSIADYAVNDSARVAAYVNANFAAAK